MARNLLMRLLDAIPTVFLVLALVFFAMRILPGDPALAALGDSATAEQLAILRTQMGLNDPLWIQFFTFIKGVLTLDFGKSLSNGRSVIDLIAYNLPYTIELTVVAMLMGIVAGVPLGVMAATNRNKWPDSSVRVFLADRLRHSRFLSRGAAADYLRAESRLVPDQWRRRRLRRPDVSRLPAGGDAGLRQGRLHRPADPNLPARSAGQGLRADRPRQGRKGEPRDLPARAAQCAVCPSPPGWA